MTIPPDPPFAVGDIVTAVIVGLDDSPEHEATVTAVDYNEQFPMPWLFDLWSAAVLPRGFRQASCNADGSFEPNMIGLTLVRHGQWPPGASTDADNRLTIGSDGGIYLGPTE